MESPLGWVDPGPVARGYGPGRPCALPDRTRAPRFPGSMRALFLLLPATLLFGSAPLGAQQASPYVPIDSWVMPYVEHLIRAGVIADPDPLTRPLKRAAIAEALAGADTARVGAATRATIRQLVAELRSPEGVPLYRADMYIGASAGTQARRDPLRPQGVSYGAYQAGIQLAGAVGPLALSSHVYTDRYLRLDPDYSGKKDLDPVGRFTDAYVSLQGKYGEVFLGALARNWGPTGLDGFVTSPYAYSYDHVMIRAGTPTVRAEVLATQLDDMRNLGDTLVHRYWSSTRFVVRPWRWLTASIDNATLWYGPNRAFELRYLNPMKLSFVTRPDDNLPDFQKSLVAGSARIALPRHVTLQGSLVVMGISSGFLSGGCCDRVPSRLGLMGAMDFPAGHGVAARAWGSVVSRWAYRAPSGPENSVMLRGVGLGQNFADYLEMGVSASLVPRPMITVSPAVVFLKQGLGDMRLVNPPLPDYGATLFGAGDVIERTLRLGLTGRAQLLRRVDLDVDAGLHFIRNKDHASGVSDTRFVGRVKGAFRFGGPVRLP